jgi:hypothetical protein
MVAFHVTMLPAGLVTAVPLLIFNLGVLADWPRLHLLVGRIKPKSHDAA